MLLMRSPTQLLHPQKLQTEQVIERQLLPDLSVSDSRQQPTAMYPRTVDQTTTDSAIAKLVIFVLRCAYVKPNAPR